MYQMTMINGWEKKSKVKRKCKEKWSKIKKIIIEVLYNKVSSKTNRCFYALRSINLNCWNMLSMNINLY